MISDLDAYTNLVGDQVVVSTGEDPMPLVLRLTRPIRGGESASGAQALFL